MCQCQVKYELNQMSSTTLMTVVLKSSSLNELHHTSDVGPPYRLTLILRIQSANILVHGLYMCSESATIYWHGSSRVVMAAFKYHIAGKIGCL